MKNYLFLAGRIRALESRLLTTAQIERMVGASSLETAFRVLAELQYAEYFDSELKPTDFLEVIATGLRETKQLIKDGSDDAVEFQLLWKEFDLNNLKQALKSNLLQTDVSFEAFETEVGLSDLGDIPLADLYAAVFDGEMSKTLPAAYVSAIEEAKSLYADTQEIVLVELLLDKAHFAYLASLVTDTQSVFLKKYFKLLVDMSNLRTLLRLLILKKPLLQDSFLPYGSFTWEEVSALETLESVPAFLLKHDYYSLAVSLEKQDFSKPQELSILIEHMIETYRNEFLTEAEQEDIGAVPTPLLYFLRRYKNAALLKFIMFAKQYNLAPERIYQTVKKLS